MAEYDEEHEREGSQDCFVPRNSCEVVGKGNVHDPATPYTYYESEVILGKLSNSYGEGRKDDPAYPLSINVTYKGNK